MSIFVIKNRQLLLLKHILATTQTCNHVHFVTNHSRLQLNTYCKPRKITFTYNHCPTRQLGSTCTNLMIGPSLTLSHSSVLCTSLIVSHRNLTKMSSNVSYTVDERGASNSLDYRVYFKDATGQPISPWHDIPLFSDQSKKIYNMVVEIPRWSNAKMEIATAEPLNPIKQDVKKGALRYVRNPFPHKGYIWNYGAFPQTWEDPTHVDPSTHAKGDNDPIDVLEIGQRVANRGEVLQVKILGTVALIDEGETDWKIITINVDDPLAEQLNDIDDVEKFMPGFLRATIEWFKIYKIPDGKPANEFAFNGEAKNREFAEKVVEETANFWKALVGKSPNESKLDLKNTKLSNDYSVKVEDSKSIVEAKAVTSSLDKVPIADQSAIDKWYYIKLN